MLTPEEIGALERPNLLTPEEIGALERPNLKKLRKAIEEVARLVDSDPAARSLAPKIAAILDEARRLEVVSKRRKLSFTDFMCGMMLPRIFAIKYGTRITTARNGAYVKFAAAMLEAIGRKRSPGTIIRSMTAVKKACANQVGKKHP